MHSPASCYRLYMAKQRATYTFAQVPAGRAHRFKFAVVRAELLECAAAEQRVTLPSSPEGNGRMTQGIQVKCMHAFRRRVRMHGIQMHLQQVFDRLALQIINADIHGA